MSDPTTSESTEQTPEPIGPVSGVEDLSPDTRALFDAYAQQQADEEGSAPPVEESTDEPPAAEPQGEDAAPPADPGEQPPAPQDPAPQPPDVFTDAFEKLREREREIDAKREELKPLEERIQQYEQTNAGWNDNRVGTLQQHIARAIGSDDPAAIRKEVEALYEDLTLTVLDVKDENSEAKKARSEAAKVRRELEEHKQKLAKAEQEREEARARSEFEQRIGEAVMSIDGYLRDTAHEFPALLGAKDALSELNGKGPAEVVWEIMSSAHERNEEITLKEAAALANEHIQHLAEKFRPLLAPKEAGQSAEPSKQTTSDLPSNPVPRTLTNSQAAQASVPAKEPEFIEDPEEAAKATLARFAAHFK